MIFGISVSDIYGCARLAYGLYEELKQAPGDCQAFAQELLLFHQMLIKISTINSENGHLDHSDQAALSACLDSCKELLCKQIVGIQEMPADLDKVGVDLVTPLPIRSEYKDYGLPFHRNVGLFRTWRQRFEKRKLALQIPKLQRAISAHIEKLNIFLELPYQRENRESQDRIEKRVVESHNLLTESSTDNGLLLDSISERLDTSQARIESQLQAILANQQKSKTPILSQTLDASSPEGRQTWMELGRLLRDEGITPAMIQNNRGLLIDAMKNTLRNKTLLAESASESYVTAPEHHTDSITLSSAYRQRDSSYLVHSPVFSPMSVLGSAPPRSSGFTDTFLARQKGAASSLDENQNVNDGMESLLQGMNDGDLTEGLELGESDFCETGGIELEEDPTHFNEDLATVLGF